MARTSKKTKTATVPVADQAETPSAPANAETLAIPASGTEVFIPLNKLKKSPRNARKTPHNEAEIAGLTMLPGSMATQTSWTMTLPSASETSAIVATSLPKGDAMATPRARRVPSSAVKGPRLHPPENSPTARSSSSRGRSMISSSK